MMNSNMRCGYASAEVAKEYDAHHTRIRDYEKDAG